MFGFFQDKSRSGGNEGMLSAPVIPETLVLMEIVGAMGLTRNAQDDVDPYVVVKRGGKEELHRTRAVENDGNPIWTIKTKSLCVVGIPEKILQEETKEKNSSIAPNTTTTTSNTLTFHVCDRFKTLGTLALPYDTILDSMNDERLEFSLVPSTGSHAKRASLALRFRPATEQDMVFLGIKEYPSKDRSLTYKSKKGIDISSKSHGLNTSTTDAIAIDLNFKEVRIKNFFQRYKKKRHGKEYIRVMPGPDPDLPRTEETEWMTREQLDQQSLQRSRQWVHAGYGTMGKIYLEIISCDDLPQMDLSLNTDDHTDPFVGIVFEDNLVRTDMLWDDPNPRWMPWTMRAFCFHVRHPTSLIMLGVFDYDETPMLLHDPVGRVVINTANFYSNTEYLLRYNLLHDPRQKDEAGRGSILIRMRIEWASEVEVVKASYAVAPPNCIINCSTHKAHQVLRYLTRGAVDMEQPSVETIKLYASEVVGYWTHYCYFLDVMFETLLWRGRLHVSPTRSFWFPIQSIALSASILISLECPQLSATMFFYLMAWSMLTINYYASRHPYPWKQVKRSEETNMVVLLGRTIHPDIRIEPNRGVKEGELIEKVNTIKGERMSNLITEFLYFMLKIYRIYSKTTVTAKFFSTPSNEWNFLSGRLYYFHMFLKYLCKYTRLYLALINWQGYYANKLTTSFLVLGTLFMLPPVHFVSWWILRILAWGLLGPWMKLVDVYWIHQWYKTSDELTECVIAGKIPKPDLPDFEALLESDIFLKMSRSGRVIGEDAIKLKDMREHVFGHFSEVIPSVDSSRFPSVPLPSSSAHPWKDVEVESNRVTTKILHVPGQKLTGTMILHQSVYAVDDDECDEHKTFKVFKDEEQKKKD